uniref:Uncharacterized protein n=1 Tax=Cucumis melo TaxID=3656 RepID=A0A9I9EGR4_CUCME
MSHFAFTNRMSDERESNYWNEENENRTLCSLSAVSTYHRPPSLFIPGIIQVSVSPVTQETDLFTESQQPPYCRASASILPFRDSWVVSQLPMHG